VREDNKAIKSGLNRCVFNSESFVQNHLNRGCLSPDFPNTCGEVHVENPEAGEGPLHDSSLTGICQQNLARGRSAEKVKQNELPRSP
jgi:hypothetical protein